MRVTGVQGGGKWLCENACLLNLDGIVAKRLDSAYLPGERSPLWLKIKRPGATPAGWFRR